MKCRIIIFFLLFALVIKAQQTIQLYDDSLQQVKLTIYLPQQCNNHPTPAIAVFPGGSYCWLDRNKEGHKVAQWLQQQGIAAFMLEYRVVTIAKFSTGARVFTGEAMYPQMLNDAKATINHIRQNAKQYNVNPEQIGTIGFSAGGHLSLMLGEKCSNDSLYHTNFTAAIYPVVTFTDKRHTHHRTRRAALGIYNQYNKKLQQPLSLELNVPPTMPPTFLLCCRDDHTVDYENTILMDNALTEKNIPHLTTIYNYGDHGFGAEPQKFTPETAQWQQTFINWLKTIIKYEY